MIIALAGDLAGVPWARPWVPCASTFPRAGRADTATRTAPAVITLANTPA